MKKTSLTLSMLGLALALILGALPQNALSQTAPKVETPAADFDAVDTLPPQWALKGVGGITLSQVSLTNWSAGGEGSLAFDAMLNYDANYTAGRHLWQNRLELAYGMATSDSRGVRKTNDKIFLNSMYGYRISKTWYVSLLGVFQTQFARGYDYATTPKTYMSRFMSPGYLGLGAGLTWKPNSWFSAYLSPATWRGTFVTDDTLFDDAEGNATLSPYGVKPGRHINSEFGGNVRLELNRDLWTDVHLYSRLDLFSNYLHKPQNIDVRWSILLTAKISKWISANLSLDMLYDDDIKFMCEDGTLGGSKFQVKQVLGIGLQTTF